MGRRGLQPPAEGEATRTRSSTRARPVQDYPDFYVADLALKNARRITDGQAQLGPYAWSAGGKLIDYTSDAPTTPKGKGRSCRRRSILPANYEPGKKYPTVVYIYEKLSDGFNRFAQPTANGFNKSVYTVQRLRGADAGHHVPVNDPGMSAVWCVLPALEAAIATGVVDRDAVGPARPLVGRLPDGVPGHADERLQGRRSPARR